VEDIAPVSPVIVTEYTIEKQRCASCGKRVTATPKDTVAFSRFGANLMISILALRYESRLPLNRIRLLLESAHGLSIRDSALQDMLNRTKHYFGARYQTLIDEIRSAPRKHADETSWRTKGENGWAWLFATEKAALYTIEETRGKGVPERILNGSPPESILTVDDYGVYKNLSLKRQSCWAHLLRVARDGESREAKTLYQQLSMLFGELSAVVQQRFVRAQRKRLYAAYGQKIRTFMEEASTERDAKKVQTRIRNQGNHLIEALLHDGAHLTNNHAERQIRPLAVFRKITGGSRSRRGAETTARNMSIMQTLKLEGRNVTEGLHELLSMPDQRFVREG
jgi:transposase